MDPDIYNFKSTGNERWCLVGCDGVWEMLSVEEIVSFIDTKIDEGVDL